MIGSLLRVLFAFLAACLAAAFVQVFFAFSPFQIASPDEGLSLLGVLSIIPKAMVQSMLFAAPFVLVAAAVAEWQGIQDWIYYTVVGVAIAFAGFTALHMGESTDSTLLHDYALRAFLTAGAIAGFVYWMAGGRDAGGRVEYVADNALDVRDAGAMLRDIKPKAPPPTLSGQPLQQPAPAPVAQQQVVPQRPPQPPPAPTVQGQVQTPPSRPLPQQSQQSEPKPGVSVPTVSKPSGSGTA